MKKRVLLILIILTLAFTPNLFSQDIDKIKPYAESPDSLSSEISKLSTILLLKHVENYSMDPSFDVTTDFQFLRQKEVVLGLEFGRYLLENKNPNPFGDNFRPRTVSEYNYAMDRYRIEGEIPIRRTGWSNFRFLFD